MMEPNLQQKNMKVLKITMGVVFFMVALSFASVPLYELTCKLMGWGGTTQEAQVADAKKKHPELARKITVRFHADTSPGMPWDFQSEQGPVSLNIGADGFASFSAMNPTTETVAGTAVYNVTPFRAGKYFYKTQCFCFGEQVLKPHEKVSMPVVFYVDPAIVEDPDLKDIDTITLSYTFFRKDSSELQKAMDDFVNDKG